MDERSYVEQKQESWHALSETLDRIRSRGLGSLPRERLDSLGGQYRAIVSDLSFARSQGASDRLVLYLNDLAGRAHGVLYASESAKFAGARAFLFRDFPRLFRSTYKYTLAAAILFFVGWAIAADLMYTVPEIQKSLIPSEIMPSKSRANPVMEAPDPAKTSSFIMTNNIREGIVAFAGGVTFGLVTVFTLLKNGLVIGAILTYALHWTSPVWLLSLLLPHGFIELTAIFICGGAGLMMGGSMIAPGNLRRADAIRIAASTSLKLFAGTLPFFIIAAIIEGFVTPSPIPSYVKLAFAGVTALGLAAYLGFGGRRIQS